MSTQIPTIGVEEELFIVEESSGKLVQSLPQALLKKIHSKDPSQFSSEFSASQIEIISKPHKTLSALRQDLAGLRAHVAECASQFGLAPIAASTHPFGDWRTQTVSEQPRYQHFSKLLQTSARRMLVSGMHVHVGIEMERRLEIRNRLISYLPLILSLSTSSPFWQGCDTGFNSYRLSVIDGMPRSGLPPFFDSLESRGRYLQTLIGNEIIQDGKEIWWDLRMSCHFPTVETRIADVCTNLDDAIAIAAFVQALALMMLQNPNDAGRGTDECMKAIIQENRWQVQRFPIQEANIITEDERLKPAAQCLEALIEELMPYAKQAGSEKGLEHLLMIVQRGTSSDRQRRLYNLNAHSSNPMGDERLFKLILDDLMEKTVAGLACEYSSNLV